MYRFDTTGQMTMLDLDTAERGGAPPKRRSGKPDSELVSIPYFHLDLLSSPVDRIIAAMEKSGHLIEVKK